MPGSLIKTAAPAFGSTKDDLIASALKPAISHHLDGAGSVREAEANTTAKNRRLDPHLALSSAREAGDAPQDYFHLFESYMHSTSRQTGKRWKDWLFQVTARSGDSNQTALEKSACCCLRTIAAKICIEEVSARAQAATGHLVSADAPIAEDSDPLATLRDEPNSKYIAEDPRTIQLLTLFTIQSLGKKFFPGRVRKIPCSRSLLMRRNHIHETPTAQNSLDFP